MSDGGGTRTRTGRAGPDPATCLLSPRELEVLQRLADRQSTARIGAALSISGNTVRTHVRRLLRKLAVDERSQAVRRARELELI